MKKTSTLQNNFDKCRAKESRCRYELAHLVRMTPQDSQAIITKAKKLKKLQANLAAAEEAVAKRECGNLEVGAVFRAPDGALYQVSRFYIRKVIAGHFIGGWMSKMLETEKLLQAHPNEAREFSMDDIENLPRHPSQTGNHHIYNWWDIA